MLQRVPQSRQGRFVFAFFSLFSSIAKKGPFEQVLVFLRPLFPSSITFKHTACNSSPGKSFLSLVTDGAICKATIFAYHANTLCDVTKIVFLQEKCPDRLPLTERFTVINKEN